MRHIGTGAQHTLSTETLCRWTGHVARSSTSQTTLSHMSPNGLSASLKLTAGTSLRCARRAPLEHVSKLPSESRPRRRTGSHEVSPTHLVRVEPRPLNQWVGTSTSRSHLRQSRRLPAGGPLLILSPRSPASPFCQLGQLSLRKWVRALRRVPSLDAVRPPHLVSRRSSRRR